LSSSDIGTPRRWSEHGMHLGGLVQAILAMGSASSDLLGEPSGELRAQLKDSPIRIFTLFLSL